MTFQNDLTTLAKQYASGDIPPPLPEIPDHENHAFGGWNVRRLAMEAKGWKAEMEGGEGRTGRERAREMVRISSDTGEEAGGLVR